MYIHVYIYVYICEHVCTYTHIYIYVCVYIFVFVQSRTGSNRIFYRNLTLTYTRSQCCVRETVRENMCEHSETINREKEAVNVLFHVRAN